MEPIDTEFSNNIIPLSNLPKFEDTTLNPLQKDYFKVMIIQYLLVYLFILAGIFISFFFDKTLFVKNFIVTIAFVYFLLMGLHYVYLKKSFEKRGFALREHDVIFKSGLLSESTVVITNNRVQHVALHQGLLSRFFGLASIELFTAGGSSSDLKINGLLYKDAKKIKESVSFKITESNDAEITPNNAISDNENQINNNILDEL